MFTYYFEAATSGAVDKIIAGGGTHVLISYAHNLKGIWPPLLKRLQRGSVKVMFDSGAFTNIFKPGTVTMDGYIEWLTEYKKYADQYVSMDVVGNRKKTISNYLKMKELGFNPMFVDHVWHRHSPDLHPFYKSGEPMCWGGMVGNPNNQKMIIGMPPMLRARVAQRQGLAVAPPMSKLHLLGIASRLGFFLDMLNVVKSVDTASWTYPFRYKTWPILTKNDQGWPRLRWCKRHRDIFQEVKRLCAKQNLDPEDVWDSGVYSVREFRKYFEALWKRYELARSRKEEITNDLWKSDEPWEFWEPDEDGDRLFKVFVDKRITSAIGSGTDGSKPAIKLNEVVGAFDKPMVLRSPAVTVVGSLAVAGESRNDVDLLVHGPLDDSTRRVIEFRLGRALPPEISKRTQFHDEKLGGPFTDFTHVYDLALVPRKDAGQVVQMATEKADDPNMDWPKAPGKRDAVVQIHTRGKSAHMDLRFKMNGHLVGWTAFAQVPNAAPDIETVAQARELYKGYSASQGNRYFKPVLAPAKLQATTKLRQPTDWLDVEGEVIGEGEVGATSREKGVVVAVARPNVEWGLQLPHFHEYFMTGDSVWKGPLYLRLLVGDGNSREGQTPEGQPFWTMWLSRSALPSVLDKRAVEKGHMPPLGQSAMPKTLMDITPREFRFWGAGTAEKARTMRDELVASKFFTDENVKIVNGQFQRIVTKRYLYQPTEKTSKRVVRYTLSWLFWRGPMVSRTGPSRQVWLMMFDAPGPGLLGWELQADPREERSVVAIQRDWKGKGLLAADQNLKPGEDIDGNVLNPTKNTPAWIRVQEHGEADLSVKDDGTVEIRIDSGRMKGDWVATPEEKGSSIWVLEHVGDQSKQDDMTEAEKTSVPALEDFEMRARFQLRKEQDRHKIEGRGDLFRLQRCAFRKDYQKTGKMNGPHCGEPATRAIIWADGRAFLPVCERHVDSGMLMLKKVNGEWAEICGTRPLPESREQGIKWWHQRNKGKGWHKRGYPSLYKADGPDRADLKPGQRFLPMKPRTGENIGEFKEVESAIREWATPDLLRSMGVFVEPKWNGMRTVAGRQKDGTPFLWFEDSKDDRTKVLPSMAKVLAGVPGEYILDSEIQDRDGKTVQPRSSLARFTGNVQPQDDSGVVLMVFRLLFWDRAGGNLTGQDEEQNHETLKRFLAFASEHGAGGRFVLTPRKKASSIEELARAVEWARKEDGSEGAMLKRPDATYSLGGGTSSWVKLKNIRRVFALVLSKEKVRGSERTWTYDCVVGPLPKDEKGFKQTVTWKGQVWVPIGRTANTNIQAEPGDIIQVAVFELQVDRKPGERRVHWFGPPQVELLRDDLKAPTSVADVEALAAPTEVRKAFEAAGVGTIELLKTQEERYVLGVVLEPTDGKDGAELKPDSQGDIYSKSEVRQAAYRFMEEFRNIGLMHRALVNGKVKILESFVVPDGTGGFEIRDPEGVKQFVQEGTWLLGLRIVDDELWAQVKDGGLTGLSIGGSARRVKPRT